ncbi:MAG TPA: hypothetical protein ENJ00_02830, partial [Phycisphaerales bacterium]|nr:hypothetical protein [Phycisphaerales bacterium]
MGAIGTVLAVVLLAVAAATVGVFVMIPLIRLVGRLVSHVMRTLVAFLADVLRFIGSVVVIPVFMLLTVISIVFGRWSATGHYGRAVSTEMRSAGLSLYRIAIGHPLRLIGLGLMMDGVEKRLPEVVAAAPGRDKPKGRKNQFEGYTIVGSLAGGGSGAKLYIAEPDDLKLAGFERRGIHNARQVVIKAFSLNEGSSLPQIIRESRALDAAKRLGLVLEHDLTNDRFFYVMRYVPGEALSLITQRAHADSGIDGLNDKNLRRLLGYAQDLMDTLSVYHMGGLWHKDVKPDNIVVDSSGAHLVDLGLITPLSSAMTLTTHGTEYFRDPELVRMALRGVKVNEVDGAKFDIYATGAVLYSMIENSFPAHSGLSQITHRCPESIRWIIRRAMTDYDKRYNSMDEMIADLQFAMASDDLFAVKPAQLPSMNGKSPEQIRPDMNEDDAFLAAAAARSPVPPSHAPASAAEQGRKPGRQRPRMRVTNWWTGRYVVEGTPENPQPVAAQQAPDVSRPMSHGAAAPVHRLSAKEQVKSARARAHERQVRARGRMASHRSGRIPRSPAGPGVNAGAMLAVAVVAGAIAVPLGLALWNTPVSRGAAMQPSPPAPPAQASASIETMPVMEALPASVSVGHPRGTAVVLSTYSQPV